jgi:hypothetical protein
MAWSIFESKQPRILRAIQLSRSCCATTVLDCGVSGQKAKLWKGRRESELELLVIDETALKLAKGRWELFSHLDSLFERIASDGPGRLARSR